MPLNLSNKLAKGGNFNQVFELVKSSVEKSLGLHRAGLTLVLADLPSALGAYHIMGSNLIVVNRVMLDAMRSLTKSREELNSFLFSILTHEYLHSLGYVDEAQVRPLVRRISEENLGSNHLSASMATGNLFDLYPQLRAMDQRRFGEDFEIIKEFDKSSMPYIG